MNFEKMKEMLKNKKVQMIAGTVAGVLVLTLAGTMLLNNKNVESKNIAIEKDNKKDNKKNVDKEKKDAKEQLEELKKTDTSNLSDEEKKDLENKIADAEKKVSNNDNDESSEGVTSNTSNSTSNSSSNSSSESTSSSNNGTSSSTQGSGSITNSKPSTGSSSSSSSSQTHTHNWVEITNVIHHEEQGHYENVLVSEAWTEEVPIYEEQARSICNGCGADITGNTTEHNRNHVLNGEKGGYHVEYIEVQVGTNKINHDAVYENKWVVDKAAWDETVTTGYKCSSCGETK